MPLLGFNSCSTISTRHCLHHTGDSAEPSGWCVINRKAGLPMTCRQVTSALIIKHSGLPLVERGADAVPSSVLSSCSQSPIVCRRNRAPSPLRARWRHGGATPANGSVLHAAPGAFPQLSGGVALLLVALMGQCVPNAAMNMHCAFSCPLICSFLHQRTAGGVTVTLQLPYRAQASS